MQIRSLVVGAAGATFALSGVALGLAGAASAAPTPSTTPRPPVTSAPVASASPSSATSSVPAPPVARPTVGSAPIQVPAGNAGPPATTAGGVTSLEIAGLIGAGVLLLGSGTVVAVRRRG